MQYEKLKRNVGCFLPAGLFFLTSGVVFAGLRDSPGLAFLLKAGAALLLGFCSVILCTAITAPVLKGSYMRELRAADSGLCLARWFSGDPAGECSIGAEGAWWNGKSWHWGGNHNLSLHDVALREAAGGLTLLLTLYELTGRSPIKSVVEIPVPAGREEQAGEVVRLLRQHNFIPHENMKSER